MSVTAVEATANAEIIPTVKSTTTTAAVTKTEHIFRSPLPDISISSHLPLHSYLFERLPEFRDRPCLISGTTGQIYSYAETHQLCQRAGAGLSKVGISKGDVIMILLQNCPEFVFSFFGGSMIGAVITTANPFYTSSEIFKQVNASSPRLIITQSSFVDKLCLTGDEDYKVVTVDSPPPHCLAFSELLSEVEVPMPEVEISPDDPVTLPFSSGTTGLPKGVILTHKSLATSVGQQVDGDNPNLYLKEDDVMLCVLPLFHIFSLNSVLMVALRAGCAVLVLPKFEIGSLLELIQKHRVSVAMVVPPLVMALAKNPMVDNYDLTSIRLVLSGAAPLGKDLEDALRQRIPNAVLGQGYGMTEAGPVLSMCPSFAKQPIPTKAGSCGIVVRNAEMKIVDPDTRVSLGYNEAGEICIRGDQIMKGYLNDAEATAATIDSQGWLYTGDIGYVDCTFKKVAMFGKCGVLAIYGFCELGYLRFDDEKNLTVLGNQGVKYEDFAVYNGQFYVVDSIGTVYWIDAKSMSLVQFSPPLFGLGQAKYLVVSEGDLFVVDLYFDENIDGESQRHVFNFEIVDMRVYRLDAEWGTWVDVKSLGDRVFVLGKEVCFSVSSKDFPGCGRNCVYFADSKLEDRRISMDFRRFFSRVFDFEDRGRMKTVDSFPSHRKLFSLPMNFSCTYESQSSETLESG